MKIQDIICIGIALMLLIKYRKPLYAAGCGIACLIVSLPLFEGWIFFTAERLVWYAALYFFLSLVFSIYDQNQVQ